MQIIMEPIGVIHSPFTEKDQTPIQASRSQAVGEVELNPKFAEGLQDVDIVDNTPLLDIKPYVPDFDVRTDIHAGWYETRSKE